MNMYVILARLTPQEESIPELEGRLRELSQLAVESSGALDYRVHRDEDGAFLVYELYPSAEARDAHLAQPAVADFLAQLPRLLTADPRVELATQTHHATLVERTGS